MAIECLGFVVRVLSSVWGWVLDLLTATGMYGYFGAMFVIVAIFRFIIYPFFATSVDMSEVGMDKQQEYDYRTFDKTNGASYEPEDAPFEFKF